MTDALSNEPQLYVKKPIPVRAVQFTYAMAEAFCFDDGPLPEGVKFSSSTTHRPTREIRELRVYCPTLENDFMAVRVGDWIVGPGAAGEFWPVKDEIFRATYEPLTALQEVSK